MINNRRFTICSIVVVASLLLASAPLSLSSQNNQQGLVAHADEALNNIINDPTFIDVNAMSVAEVQSFLGSKGGFLKDFNENGRSAAQIIVDASHGYGDATGTINGIALNSSTGTVSPRVILVTLQKEQGLLTMPNRNDDSLRAAMGYGCPDSGECNGNYAGFTKQVEWGAWQLRYNYERAQGRGFSDYQVGQTMTIDNQAITFANRATASLYRYTPHIQSFRTLFNSYFVFYDYEFVNQNTYPTIARGDAYNFVVTIKNTGSATWQRGVTNLATDRNRDRVPAFTREGPSNQSVVSGWVSPNRIQFEQQTVAPGQLATYSFWMRSDNVGAGTSREYFRPVVDGVGWMKDVGIYWDVKTLNQFDSLTVQYRHQIVGQNPYPTLPSNQAYGFVLLAKNTGTKTWKKGQINLGTDRNRDRITPFVREPSIGSIESSGWISPNRITMQEASVAPGEVATFTFFMRAQSQMTPGTYHESFRLVNDEPGGIWMEDYGVYWDVNVQ